MPRFVAHISERFAFCTDRLRCYVLLRKGMETPKVGGPSKRGGRIAKKGTNGWLATRCGDSAGQDINGKDGAPFEMALEGCRFP